GRVRKAVADEVDQLPRLGTRRQQQQPADAAPRDLVAAARVDRPGAHTWIGAGLPPGSILGPTGGAGSLLRRCGHARLSGPVRGCCRVFDRPVGCVIGAMPSSKVGGTCDPKIKPTTRSLTSARWLRR